MSEKMKTVRRTMGARPTAEHPLTPGPSRGELTRAEIVTVVRRLGYVALRVFETIQGNLVSSGRHQYAEALNDSLKPLVDLLVHFELEDEPDTEVDHEVP